MNLKHSKQRDSIKEFLSTRKDHPTADVVYTNVRRFYPNISLGTVYRNLTLLADIGEITRLRIGDGADRFDYNTSPHYHFACSACGNVSDFDFPFIERMTETARQNFKGEIEGQITYFYGRCENCSKQQMPVCDANYDK